MTSCRIRPTAVAMIKPSLFMKRPLSAAINGAPEMLALSTMAGSLKLQQVAPDNQVSGESGPHCVEPDIVRDQGHAARHELRQDQSLHAGFGRDAAYLFRGGVAGQEMFAQGSRIWLRSDQPFQ